MSPFVQRGDIIRGDSTWKHCTAKNSLGRIYLKSGGRNCIKNLEKKIQKNQIT
jgi:hypothetical protein